MSEILNLARSFEEKLKQQASDTDEKIKAALKQHESALLECLKAEQKKIESAIQEHSRRLRASLLKSWLGALIAMLAVLMLGGGVLYWMTTEIRNRYAELDKLPNAKVTTCGKLGRLCVEIDPIAPTYGPNGEYRVVKGG
uniref:Probable mobilization protein B n=2 Tax=Salmonella enterica TaxID=28901 RepID=E0A207_SALEN|nr:probable mobilization protein B [Salmonella enterica subsp. enterica serovar Enteritidis]